MRPCAKSSRRAVSIWSPSSPSARGKEGSETYPAYVAAVRAAVAHKQDDTVLDVALIVASQAGIGSGGPFTEPGVEGDGGMWRYMLNKPLIPAPLEIVLPAGAPSPLCLYADFRPRQLDTPIYLPDYASSSAIFGQVQCPDTLDLREGS